MGELNADDLIKQIRQAVCDLNKPVIAIFDFFGADFYRGDVIVIPKTQEDKYKSLFESKGILIPDGRIKFDSWIDQTKCYVINGEWINRYPLNGLRK